MQHTRGKIGYGCRGAKNSHDHYLFMPIGRHLFFLIFTRIPIASRFILTIFSLILYNSLNHNCAL